jgi:DNA-binding NarL/FixJ family response regulator
VLVAAASFVVRAGLKSLVERMPGCCVADADADVILWHLAPDEDASAQFDLRHQAVLLLTSHAPAPLIRAGARGVLTPEATETQISAAIHAVAAGLIVLAPEPADVLPHTSNTLTGRETEVLRLIAEGLANKEIAWRLGLSEHTVKFHVSSLLGKLGAATRAEAIGVGLRNGVIML